METNNAKNSQNTNPETDIFRVIVEDQDKRVLFDQPVEGRPEPTEWTKLPDALGIKGKEIVEVTRSKVFQDTFNIKVREQE